MEDATWLFNNYREATRNLWNCYFTQNHEGLPSADTCESFRVISNELFSSIVLRELGIKNKRGNISEALGLFEVKLKYTETPVFINRSIPAGGYWDYPITKINREGFSFRLLEFFDWDGYKFMENQYLRVEILKSDMKQHELIGRHLLIECFNAKIYYIA